MARDAHDNASPDAEEATESESKVDSALFTVLTNKEVALARKNIAQGKSFYLVRLRFRLSTIDIEVAVFEKAIKQFGETITYLPTKSPVASDSIELDFLIASDAPEATLQEAFKRFEVMIRQVPATEEWLTEWDRQQNFADSTNDVVTSDEFLAAYAPQNFDFIPESSVNTELLNALTDAEENATRRSIAQGKQLHRVRLRFKLRSINDKMSAFKDAVGPLGDVITYMPTSSALSDDDLIEIDFLIASDAPEDTLQLAFTRFGATIHAVPEMNKWLTDLDRQQTLLESDDEPTTVDELLNAEAAETLGFIRGNVTHRIHFHSHVSTIEQDLDRLKAALDPHGEIVDYLPTSEDAEDVDVFDLHVLIESKASVDTLRAALAHLGMTVEEAPRHTDQEASPTTDFAPDAAEFFQYPAQPSTAQGHSSVKPELLGIFRENPDHPAWADVNQDQILYRIRALFSLAIFDRCLDEFKNALKPHGEPIAFSLGDVGDDVDSVEIDIWFASSAPEDALRSAFSHFAATLNEKR